MTSANLCAAPLMASSITSSTDATTRSVAPFTLGAPRSGSSTMSRGDSSPDASKSGTGPERRMGSDLCFLINHKNYLLTWCMKTFARVDNFFCEKCKKIFPLTLWNVLPRFMKNLLCHVPCMKPSCGTISRSELLFGLSIIDICVLRSSTDRNP